MTIADNFEKQVSFSCWEKLQALMIICWIILLMPTGQRNRSACMLI